MIERIFLDDWDFAAIQFKSKPPMMVERAVCSIKSSEDNSTLVVTMQGSKHPVEPNKTCTVEHHLLKEDINTVSYFTESRIKSL